MINNSLIAMNYLLLQNQFILQQNNQNLMNTISNNINQHLLRPHQRLVIKLK